MTLCSFDDGAAAAHPSGRSRVLFEPNPATDGQQLGSRTPSAGRGWPARHRDARRIGGPVPLGRLDFPDPFLGRRDRTRRRPQHKALFRLELEGEFQRFASCARTSCSTMATTLPGRTGPTWTTSCIGLLNGSTTRSLTDEDLRKYLTLLRRRGYSPST